MTCGVLDDAATTLEGGPRDLPEREEGTGVGTSTREGMESVSDASTACELLFFGGRPGGRPRLFFRTFDRTGVGGKGFVEAFLFAATGAVFFLGGRPGGRPRRFFAGTSSSDESSATSFFGGLPLRFGSAGTSSTAAAFFGGLPGPRFLGSALA